MIGGNGKLVKGFLIPDLCFALWVETKSISKATKRLLDAGACNPKTGEPFRKMSVWKSARISDAYKAFVEKRSSGQETSEEPTPEEYAQASQMVVDLMPKQMERIAETKKFFEEHRWSAEVYMSRKKSKESLPSLTTDVQGVVKEQ